MPAQPEPAPQALRHARLDALRGAAIVWMVLFHFSFDLNTFNLLSPRQDFYRDAFWTGQRTCIVSLFLLTAGIGQSLALAADQSWHRFWRRWAQVAGCAVLVSLGSAWMFPRSWISFGVLHGMAVMLLLVRPLLRLLGSGRAWVLWPLGGLALALPWLVQHPFFDSRWMNWLGLVTHKPVAEDYVPVLPWLGVMLWGLAAGQELLRRRRAALTGGLPGVLQPLAALGRWALSFYMLHQLVLLGGLTAGRALGWW